MITENTNESDIGAAQAEYYREQRAKRRRRIACIDIESTGTNPATDRIIELAAINSLFGSKSWRVNPGIPIPNEATKVHGIRDCDVAGCKSFVDIAKEVFESIEGCDLLGFNLSNFDVPLLWEEFYRAGIEWDLSDVKIFDAGTLYKRREERTLTAAVRFYCGAMMENAHDAMADAVATADVWAAQLKRYGLEDADRETLAKESSYEEIRVDLAGKIIVGKDGRPTYNFGKVKGVAVEDDTSFAYWMLNRDFTQNTKMHLVKILESLS